MDARVLIVEDSRTFSSMLSRSIFLKSGVKPVVTRSLAETQRTLSQGQYKFFATVVDLNLPDAMKGQIVPLVLSYELPTIVLTSSYDKEMRDNVLQMDILDYLVKGGRVVEHILNILRRIRINNEVKVLIVDDAKVSRTMIKKLLGIHHYHVLEAKNGLEAMTCLDEHKDIKLVITDCYMPHMDGFDLISRIRQRYAMEELAIIGLSSSESEHLTAQFLKMGANDFLYKGFSVEEFYCRVRQNIDLVERFEEVKEASNRDYLTGLYNRRYFFKAGSDLVAVCKRASTPIAIAMIDIDYFKKINDQFGHEAGDMVLREFGNYLRENTRRSDIVARFGGEEFCFMATNISEKAAPLFFKRFCQAISMMNVDYLGHQIKFTISIGVTMVDNMGLDEAIRKADTLLYKAKQDGRNRVVTPAHLGAKTTT